MIFVFIFAIFGCAFSKETLVASSRQQQCAEKGPSYWCANEFIAADCYATQFCAKNVWNKNKETQKVTTDLCTECKQYVGTIHLFLSNNETRAEIITEMKALCQLMPEASKLMCTEVVTLYGNQMLDAFVAYTAQPQKFCSLIRLCNASLHQHQQIRNALMATDYCMTCQQFLGTIHLLLANKATQQEVISAITSSCQYCPEKYRGECSQVMAEFAPIAVNWLVGYLATPKKFCTTIGLCSSAAQVPLLQSETMKNIFMIKSPKKLLKAVKFEEAKPIIKKSSVKDFSSEKYCETCLFVFRYVDKMMTEKQTEDQIRALLEQSCVYLKGLVPNCKELVDQYADEAIKLLVDNVLKPEEVCMKLHMCPAAKNQARKQEKSVKNAITCELCTMVMGYVDNLLEGNDTEAEIKEALDKVCSLMPSQYESQCDQYVNDFAGVITEFLLQQLDPKLVCNELKLCTSQSVKKLPKVGLCEVCEEAMTYLDKELSDKSTEDEITNAVKSLCNFLPQYINTECQALVSQYGDEIISLLVKEIDPKTICTALQLCSSGTENKVKNEVAQKSSVKSAVECELCDVVMGYVDNLLKGKTAQEDIEKALDKVCNIIPTKYTEECDQLVASYSGIITQLLMKELNPTLVCEEIKMCDSQRNKLVTSSRAEQTITCELCEYAMGYLSSLVTSNSTEKEVEAALDKLCSYLPSSYSSECDALVKEYGDKIIDLIIKDVLSPAFICKALGLCMVENPNKAPRYMLALRNLPKSGTACVVCEYAMGVLDSKLESKTVEQVIEAEVEKLCGYLPATFGNECDALITEYGDNIIQLIVQQLQPALICKELHVCS